MQYLLTEEEFKDRVDAAEHNRALHLASDLHGRVEGWILKKLLEAEDYERLSMCPMAGERTNEAARLRGNKNPHRGTRPGDCVTCRYCDLCLYEKRIGMPTQTWKDL